jgi:hypothetical protein
MKNNITRKLQKMVQSRKVGVVVSEQKKYNQYGKPRKNNSSLSDYYTF